MDHQQARGATRAAPAEKAVRAYMVAVWWPMRSVMRFFIVRVCTKP